MFANSSCVWYNKNIFNINNNLVKMHSKSPSVMAFCPGCLGILPYSWQNTSRDITCEQLPKAAFFSQKGSCPACPGKRILI